jgi:hypothetical protein
MAINDPQVQIATAIPPLEPRPSRKGTTYRASIYDGRRTRRQVFLKLLKIEDIAREALCAVLARVVALPIRQAFYVHVDPVDVPGQRSGNPHRLAFGLEQEHYLTFRIANDQTHDAIRRWDDALACGVFDQWIFNEDRLPNNLLRASNNVFWLIDHDEALPSYARADQVCNSQILQVLREGKTELDLHRLRRKALHVIERFRKVNWTDLTHYVLSTDVAMTDIRSHIEKHIEFLRRRIEHMPDILTHSLKIRQLDMRLESYTSPVDRKEKK